MRSKKRDISCPISFLFVSLQNTCFLFQFFFSFVYIISKFMALEYFLWTFIHPQVLLLALFLFLYFFIACNKSIIEFHFFFLNSTRPRKLDMNGNLPASLNFLKSDEKSSGLKVYLISILSVIYILPTFTILLLYVI